jgi:lipoyl(octanoyl) transferase
VIYRTLDTVNARWAWCGTLAVHDSDLLQARLAEERRNQRVPDTLLFLEHPHTYTLGRSATLQDILADPAWLKQHDVSIHQSDRGGQVTYHGPGQLLIYVIMDICKRRLSVPAFVSFFEEVLIQWLFDEGIVAVRERGAHGLWYQGKKMASLGFRISRGISRHGLALNLQPDLNFFEGIIPCGQKRPVSSLAQATGKHYDLAKCAQTISLKFSQLIRLL